MHHIIHVVAYGTIMLAEALHLEYAKIGAYGLLFSMAGVTASHFGWILYLRRNKSHRRNANDQ